MSTDLVVDVIDQQPHLVSARSVRGTASVAAVAAVVALLAATYVWQQDWFLLIGDAQSHLNIARRVNDAVQPDFVKIGTVWLPFPHLLLLPLVQSYALWQSGWAGAIVGIGCMAVSSAALWRVGRWIGFGIRARIIVVGVFVLNPTILYLHTIALTEAVLIAGILAALAGLAGWIVAEPPISPGELTVFAGIPTAAAVLSRYEGWAFAMAAAAFIVVVSLRRWRSPRYTVSLVLAYLAVPAAGAAWWISFNWVRFGDPLEFARGQYSAASQQALLVASGALPAKGNLGLSMWTYDWAIISVIGIPVLLLAAVGAVLLLWTRGLSTTALVIWLLASLYPFAILTLYLGQNAIFSEHTLPQGLWNQRYAACLVPLAALLIGVLVDVVDRRGPRGATAAAALVAAVVMGFLAWSVASPIQRIDVIGEGYSVGANGLPERVGSDGIAVASFVGDHYAGGEILMDETAILQLGYLRVPLATVVGLYTGDPFEENLRDVSPSVSWVLVDTANPGDRVWSALKDNASFRSRFAVVFESDTMQVFQRVDSGGARP